LPEPHPVDAKPIAAPEAPREPYLVLTSGAIIGDAADLAAFKAGKEFPSGSKPVAYGEPAEPFADVPANVASPDAGRTKAARVPGTRAIDITGHRYNLLTAVAYEGADDCGFAIWRFHCDCGNEKSIRSYRVRTGAYVSCGCFEKSAVRQRRKQDGQLTEQEIAEWREIVGEKREPTEPLTNIPAIVAPPEVVEPVVSAPNAPCMHTLDLGTLPTNKPAKRTEPKLSKAQRKAEKRAHRNERQAERAMQAARDAGRPVFALKQVAVASKAVVLLAGYGMHRRRIV